MHRTLLLAFWFAASCSSQAPFPADPVKPKPEPAEVEPNETEPIQSDAAAGHILGVMQTQGGLILQVDSGGCRKPADVSFTVVAGKLSIAAVTPDHCEAEVPLGEELLFPWAELPTFGELGIIPGPASVLQPGTTAGPTTAPVGAIDEPIYGVLVKPDGLDIRVSSGGCTSVEHFTAWIEPGATELVHLVRTKLDSCEAYVPEGKLLHFTWAQLGVTKSAARLVNPLDELVLKK